MWYKNVGGRFFGLVTKHACDGRTDGQNYDSQDRASIARALKSKLTLECGTITLLTVIPERVQIQTPTTAGRDASYKLNVVAEARSGG